MSESKIAIRVDDLTVAYNYKPVLWDIDLEVPEGVPSVKAIVILLVLQVTECVEFNEPTVTSTGTASIGAI